MFYSNSNMASTSNRRALSLKEKTYVIECSEKQKIGVCTLVKKFEVE